MGLCPLLRLLLLVRARSRRLHSVKVYDFFRVASTNRPAKSLRGIHGSVGWCALLCSLWLKSSVEKLSERDLSNFQKVDSDVITRPKRVGEWLLGAL